MVTFEKNKLNFLFNKLFTKQKNMKRTNYNTQLANFKGWLSLMLLTAFTSLSTMAQNVNVSGSTGADGTYATLFDAFAPINSNAQTGNNVVIEIVNNTTEIASAVLNAGAWTSLIIKPSGGAARTITGAITGHLIDLNGASNVVIDGLNAGGNTLTISNTTIGATSAIRFTNDASNNMITRCSLQASTNASFGVVYFGAGTVTGNDGNSISNCDITGAGANLPLNGIYSLGTSAAIDNSGNTISNNNIYNYFNAGAASSGMNINSGNSTWTISGNSFYQTSTRTYTTASTHNGIAITSGAGYTITGNYIGGNTSSAGGTPYAMAGTIATRFIGINVAAGTTAAVNSIQGNFIRNITLATSSGATTTNGIICGINLTAGNANIGTISANTIGASSGVDNIKATATTTGGLVVGINTSSTGTVSIQNNIIGSLTSSGTTATIAGSITGINVSGAALLVTISNNTIGNSTPHNMRGGTLGLTTGSSLVSGINLPSTPTTANINSNTIQNLTSYGTNTAGYVRGIQTTTASLATATGWTINSNVINNLTTNSTLVGIGSGLCSALGIHHLASQGCTISQNTISNISNINTTATTNIIVAGIVSANASVTTSLGINITRNKIFGLSNSTIGTTALTPPIVAGIAVRSGNNVTTLANNMISLGSSLATNTSFIGIWNNNGSTPNPTSINVYYNSVHIDGTATAGALPSFAYLRAQYILATANTVNVDVKNNIFQNNRSGGTGQHFAIGNGYNSTPSSIGWSSNNNVLNVANAATLGHWTTAQNLATWQLASLSDGLSLTNIPLSFTNTPTADLHLTYGLTPTQVESGGVVVAGVTTDFDNDNRPGPTGSLNGGAYAPDMGADEIDAVPLDITAPVASNISLLGNACSPTGRTITALIADASGVDNAGSEPQLYFRKNGVGTYNSVAGTLTSGTATSGTWTFNMVYPGSMLPINVGDVIQYFIVAQDVAPTFNVGSNPSAGFSGTDVYTVTTPPTTPLSFNIQNTVSGTYPVGVGQSGSGGFETITAAVNFFNTSCLSGPIVFNLMDATYGAGETFPIVINANPDASATNTLTIKPNTGVISTISGTVNSYLFRVLNNYTTIDGSNNGTTTRDLTISNLSATTPSVMLIGSTGTNPIHHIAVKNTNLINGANSASNLVISDAATPGTAGYFNNITIQNNSIQRAYIGLYSIAAVSAGNGNALLITQNDLNTSGANSIRLVGIYMQGVDGGTISNNNVGNMANAAETTNISGIFVAAGSTNYTITGNNINSIAGTAGQPVGIRLANGNASSGANVSDNIITAITSAAGVAGPSAGIQLAGSTGGVNIFKNKVTNVKNTNTGGWGASGILLGSSSTAANVKLYNNFVSDVAAYGFNGSTLDDNGYGIMISAGGGYSIWHNTVNMVSNQTLTTASSSAAINIQSTVTTAGSIDIRNNIFANNQTGGAPERYAIVSGAANTVFSNINHNDYFTTGPTLGFIGINRATLADIVTGFGGNANSLNVNPVFVGSPDLHLNPASNSGLNNFGTPIATVTTDIDNEARSATTPDMGADEFGAKLDVKVWLEGYFDGVSAMIPVMTNQNYTVTAIAADDVDDITIELRLPATPTVVTASAVARVKTTGLATANFTTSVPADNYYIVINHRNHVQTWSKDPVAFPYSGTYNFTDDDIKAYGDNMALLLNGEFGMYSGDINQDEYVDSFDYGDYDLDVQNNVSGVYVATDLNGDGYVDSFDYGLMDINTQNNVSSQHP